MKLFLRENKDLAETEVEIRYRIKDDEVDALINAVNSSADVLIGINEAGDTERVFVSGILFFEAVDRDVFAYKTNGIYKVRKTLYELEDDLAGRSFVRISKSTIVNINAVRSAAPEDSRRVIFSPSIFVIVL